GSELRVCGHYTNTGYVDAAPGSTVRMVGSLTPQNMTGYMTTFSKFANLIIDKDIPARIVRLNADCETAGNFTIAQGNFQLNGYDHFAGGNFTVDPTGFYIPGTGSTHFNGAAAQTFTNNGSCTFNNVLMVQSPASGLTLNHNMVLGTSGNLTLTSGWITTGANRVIVNNPAVGSVTPGNANSYVRGNLRRFVNTTGAYNFPVGNASKGYQRININFTTAHGGAGGGGYQYLDASFHDGALGGSVIGQHECGNFGYDTWLYYTAPADLGYWRVEGGPGPITAPGIYTAIGYPTNYAAVFNTYNYTNITGNASATLAKGPINTALVLEGNCMYGSSPSTGVGRTGLSGFSDFGIAIDIETPFPVEMSPLTAEALGSYIRLSWATSSEANNRGFDIERSTDAATFVNIGWKEGAGNSTSMRNYTFDDRTAKPGVRYFYRLRQVDFDGNARYSNVATAVLPELIEFRVSVYPNPTDGAFVLNVSSPDARLLNIEAFDLTGRRVMQTSAKVEAGVTEIPLTLNGLAAGAYQLKVGDGEKSHIVRIQKK
ncbi:MAG: T9SS type A sorting domain-containing protein, partial [Bacteroidia bacterium]|nr:T9SS type A sorting domain-containing protein [Bacteroidia bacterium]MDW8334100.1 T9SS type A sorting domain-containing protein [Bacteroidia bacterium]